MYQSLRVQVKKNDNQDTKTMIIKDNVDNIVEMTSDADDNKKQKKCPKQRERNLVHLWTCTFTIIKK